MKSRFLEALKRCELLKKNASTKYDKEAWNDAYKLLRKQMELNLSERQTSICNGLICHIDNIYTQMTKPITSIEDEFKNLY